MGERRMGIGEMYGTETWANETRDLVLTNYEPRTDDFLFPWGEKGRSGCGRGTRLSVATTFISITFLQQRGKGISRTRGGRERKGRQRKRGEVERE